MYNVNVEIHFVLSVEVNHIDLAIVQLQQNGKSKIQMKVKILLGLWLIQNNVLNVESLLKKIKAVII